MGTIDDYLDEHAWSEQTRDNYRRALLRCCSEIRDLTTIGPSEFKAWLESHEWGPAMIWVTFCAVRAFIRWKFGSEHPALRLKIKREQSPPGRSLKIPKIQELLASFNTQSVKGRRDLAIAGLMLDSALRISEVCALMVSHLDIDDRKFDVIVKGGDWGAGTFSQHTAVWLSAWMMDRITIALPKEKTVFVSVNGNLKGSHLTRSGLQHEINKWGERIRIKLSPHDLRRTFGNQTTRAGAAQRVVMLAGRWTSESAFKRYTMDLEPSDIDEYLPVEMAMK